MTIAPREKKATSQRNQADMLKLTCKYIICTVINCEAVQTMRRRVISSESASGMMRGTGPDEHADRAGEEEQQHQRTQQILLHLYKHLYNGYAERREKSRKCSLRLVRWFAVRECSNADVQQKRHDSSVCQDCYIANGDHSEKHGR